jgi:hypothetical protein
MRILPIIMAHKLTLAASPDIFLCTIYVGLTASIYQPLGHQPVSLSGPHRVVTGSAEHVQNL